MAPNDHLLAQLCSETETLTEARILLRNAQIKTGPGTGYELGPHTTGLPAICAYIASQRLNNGDVKRPEAQIASCLKAADFDKAFHIVQAAIGGSRRQTAPKVTYDSLIQRYKIPMGSERLAPWMRETESMLLRSDARFGSEPAADVKLIIFFWVCSALKGKRYFATKSYCEENNISVQTFNSTYETLSEACTPLKARLIADFTQKRAKAPTPATPSRKSPTKATLRVLPSKDTPQKRKVAFPQPEPIENDEKEVRVPQTPMKKRRVESPSKSVVHPSPNKASIATSRVILDPISNGDSVPPLDFPPIPTTPRRSGRAPRAKAIGANTLNVDDAPSSSDDGDAPLAPRRFRPVCLDQKQWHSRDPRLGLIWKQGEKHKKGMTELYGHPFAQYAPC